jgi:hypothetical protein
MLAWTRPQGLPLRAASDAPVRADRREFSAASSYLLLSSSSAKASLLTKGTFIPFRKYWQHVSS